MTYWRSKMESEDDNAKVSWLSLAAICVLLVIFGGVINFLLGPA